MDVFNFFKAAGEKNAFIVFNDLLNFLYVAHMIKSIFCKNLTYI